MSALDMNAVAEQGLGVLRALWQVTWQGALWALVVWMLTRALPRLPSSARAMLWWLVGLKCLVGLCAPTAIRLPLLPAPEAPAVVVKKVAGTPAGEQPPLMVAKSAGAALPTVSPPEHTGTRMEWTLLALGVLLAWLGGIAWHGRELLQGLAQLRRIRREARPLEDATLLQAAATLGRELGLARIPQLLISEHAASPLALGLLRPEVILPRKALVTLSPQEQRMALAHELAHVRRGDLWLGWVPALARAVFFFHPLVRRACQEYALAREEACDAAALQATGAAPREYGRLLLIFGVARAPAAAAAPGASSHLAALKRRIAMLEHAGIDSKHRHHWARWALGGLALVALVPFQVVAREAELPVTPPPAPLLTQAPTAPAKPTEPIPAVPATKAPVPVPATKAPVPVPVVAPRLAVATQTRTSTLSSLQHDEDSRFSYVYLQSSDNATMSGSMQDLKVARSLARNEKLPVLYLRRDDGQEYLIRDAATLKSFDDAFKVVREIGEKQGALGEKQGALGEKQGEFGEKMGALGEKMGALGQKQGALGRKQARISLARSSLELEMEDKEETPDSKRQLEQLEREEKDLEKQIEEFEKQMEPLNEQMEALNREMEKYNAPMEELGEQMEALGEQMEAHSREAEKKAEALFEDAIRKGVAQPVKR